MIATASAGLAAGFAAHVAIDRRSAAPPKPWHPPPQSGALPADAGRSAEASPLAARVIADAGRLRSTDTISDLLALDEADLCDRATLWFIDARAGQIEQLWEALRTLDDPAAETMLRLLFARWTRIDPLQAIHATAGTPRLRDAWRAWAANDPEAALAHAMDSAPEQVRNVVYATSLHDARRALEWVKAHPEFDIRWIAEGFVTELARDDPEAALEFQKLHGGGVINDPLAAWARRDPRAALDWVMRQPADSRRNSSLLNMLIKTLQTEDPAWLADLAAEQPPGMVRRSMERALFESLCDTDPVAALRQARATESTRVAAERFAAVGRRLLATDPDLAFEAFGELFAAWPDALSFDPGNRPPGRTALPIGGADDLARALSSADPRRTMELVLASREDPAADWNGSSNPGSRVAQLWSATDFDGYCQWVREQQGMLRDAATGTVVRSLVERRAYQDAVSWAEGSADQRKRDSQIYQVLLPWMKDDRAAALSWYGQAEVSARLADALDRVFEETEP